MKQKGILRKSQGFSAFINLFILFILAMNGYIIVKTSSAYLDDFYVSKILTQLQNEYQTSNKILDEASIVDMRNKMATYFRINSIYNISPELLKLENNSTPMLLMDYTIKRHIFANVDILINFHHKVLLKNS